MNHSLKGSSKGETLQPCRVSPWSRSFTLIELLVVIAILGILSAGILTAINVTSNLDKAKLAKAKTFSKSLENSLSVSQVGKWSFEEQSGNTANDTSGNNNNGTLIGINGPAPTRQDETTCGLGFGRCLSFNGGSGGTGQYVQVPHSDSLAPTRITLSAWVYRTGNCPSVNDTCMIVNKEAPNQLDYEFGIRDVNTLQWAINTDTNPATTWINTEKVIPQNKWTHVAVAYDGQQVKSYIDGAMIHSQPLTGNITNRNGCLKIGGRDGCSVSTSSIFLGRIDEVAIYNQALTASQTRELYAQGLPKHQLTRRIPN